MKETKIQFSTAEMDLMRNKEIILTKNKILQKIKASLEELQEEMISSTETFLKLLPDEIFSIQPKISKGENYLGLPYLILDFPRCFQQENIFAVRTMFWWGNFFSTTLHLSGRAKITRQMKIADAFAVFAKDNYYIGINTNPWVHHFEKDNYKNVRSLKEEEFRQLCKNSQHLKVAKKISLNDPALLKTLLESWKQLIKNCYD